MTRIAAVAAEAFEVVAAAAPDGVEVRRLAGPESLAGAGFVVPGSGDDAVHDAIRAAAGVEVVQVLSAGTDWIEGVVPAGATLCNARGARDAPVAEWVAAGLLGASSGLLRAAAAPITERWQPAELGSWRVVVLGMGSIGAAVAERLAPFGTVVVGVASRARDGVHGVDELPGLLGDADALVVLTPLTDATRGLVDAAVLAALPDGAVVLNAGRGPVVDRGSLLAELASGRLRAVLDVTDPEPLPEDDPLRSAPGTLAITPHVAGDTEPALHRAAAFAGEQLGRWARGEPLENVVQE